MNISYLIDKDTAKDMLLRALKTGGSFAEIYVEHTVKNSMTLINGSIDRAVSGVDYGLGLRIFDGFGAIYAYTNDLSYENLMRIADEAAEAVKNPVEGIRVMDFTVKKARNISPIKIMPEKVSKKEVSDLLKEASDSAFKYSTLITQTNGSYSDVVQKVNIITSEGLWAEDERVLTNIAVASVASSETEKQNGFIRKGARKGFELLEEINMAEYGRKSAETAVTMLKADLCPSGSMPVVIDNGFGGVIFHEACGHGLEATAVAKNASVFCGKLGKQIASEKVTAIDDGAMPNEWGSLNIDDEGTPTQKNILIEKGILKSYLVDKLNGLKMNMNSTGSGRRESYRFAPTSRMNNTYLAAGTDKKEDIISSVEYGLYAKNMGGGSVSTATGDFNFAVNEAYMIEKGKITNPVRGATLIGKGSEILMDIDMVSDNLALAQGMCGSISGLIPTNVGQPTIRVKKITVGGRK